MSSVAVASPYVRRAPAFRPGKSFLSHVTIDYGPADLLGRLFLLWDADLRRRGITLTFGPVDMLLAVNRHNPDSWRPLVPVFDAEIGGFTEENGFALFGFNADGDVIAAQAARLYTLTKSTFQEESESLRLFYADPAALGPSRRAVHRDGTVGGEVHRPCRLLRRRLVSPRLPPAGIDVDPATTDQGLRVYEMVHRHNAELHD
ncbi:MAG: hypothetical protein HC869_14185 [Rhodospirillales bacterium]|nr:hypothetical protein [Rhodospirillales bacterium]